MKLFSFIISVLVLYLLCIQVSFCDSDDAETEIVDTTLNSDGEDVELEDQNGMKEKMQVDPSEEDDEELDANGDNGGDIQNQDDDTDSESTAQPNPAPVQPNPDQPRVYSMPVNPSGRDSENMPQPEYRPEYNPGYGAQPRVPQQCHSGQYQCQKTDPNAQTRCIPQEWRCNGLRDCELNDDESGCTTDQLTRGRTQTKCTSDQYQCHGSGLNSVPPHCIDRRQVCDGTYQCSYGDDEANCADRRPSVYPVRVPTQDRQTDPRMPEQHRPAPDPRQLPDSRTDPRDNRDMYRPQAAAGDRKSEEYVQRLEWRDRCFRSCLKY